MDVNKTWTAQQWMNRRAELLARDPCLAQRLLSKGLQLDPKEAIGWFNLGIGLHQQRRIPAAVRAYQQCLALPKTRETEQSARNNLAQDLPARRTAKGMAAVRISIPAQTRQSSLVYRGLGPSHRDP